MAMDPAIKEGAPVGYYDDDRPVPSEPGSLPPEVQAPLLPFRGREPDAPAWFLDAIAQEPERSFVTSKGIVTHRFGLADWRAAFDCAHAVDSIKVLLVPEGK